ARRACATAATRGCTERWWSPLRVLEDRTGLPRNAGGRVPSALHRADHQTGHEVLLQERVDAQDRDGGHHGDRRAERDRRGELTTARDRGGVVRDVPGVLAGVHRAREELLQLVLQGRQPLL